MIVANPNSPGWSQPSPADRTATERLILSTILAQEAIPSSEIARLTRLSAQTASVVTRSLEADGLLIRGAPVRGKVGKPTTPLTLDPDGALSLGLKIGRRTADLVLVDFLGQVRRHEVLHYPYPTPECVTGFVAERVARITGDLSAAQRGRLAGLGLAVPHELWNWLDILGGPPEEMRPWRDLDLPGTLMEITGLPVCPGNDGTMACAAETLFGVGAALSDYAYFHIGSFLGGGIVLNGVVYPGRTGNAGALGTLPVGVPVGGQLLETASLFQLERRLAAAGYPREALWAPESADWVQFGDVPEPWIANSIAALVRASVAVSCVIDFEAIVIDGRLPPVVRDRIVAGVVHGLAEFDTQGIAVPQVLPGSLGHRAGVLGAAYQPILRRYLRGGAGMV